MKKFLEIYNTLNVENIYLLKEVYSFDIQFIDPAHEVNGLDDLIQYFSALYQNVRSIDFEFKNIIEQDNLCYLQWDMTYRHKTFAAGRPIIVSGTTFLELSEDGKICYHRDYFDLGAMVYEHVPILGRLVSSIKRRLGQ